jgi:RimJ/RimL family protein N-acetyltransferase
VIICESERLILRLLDPHTDAPFILDLLNQPSFIRNIADRGVRTLADAARYIETGPLAMYAQHGIALFRAELKDTHAPIGLCGLLKRDWLADVDIGFAFLPQHWSKGYAFESAAAVIAWAREQRGITRVVAITAPDNTGSQRVLEKLGLRYSKTIHSPQGQESRLYTPAGA